jgi:hypothetical protein
MGYWASPGCSNPVCVRVSAGFRLAHSAGPLWTEWAIPEHGESADSRFSDTALRSMQTRIRGQVGAGGPPYCGRRIGVAGRRAGLERRRCAGWNGSRASRFAWSNRARTVGPATSSCGWVAFPETRHQLLPSSSVGLLLVSGSSPRSCVRAASSWRRPGERAGRSFLAGGLLAGRQASRRVRAGPRAHGPGARRAARCRGGHRCRSAGRCKSGDGGRRTSRTTRPRRVQDRGCFRGPS